jgi:hypothetical protein
MKTKQLFDFGVRLPRRNLPLSSRRKRGESNFVSAFSKAYLSSLAQQGIGGRDFALSGFGIADFIWYAWQHFSSKDGTALSVRNAKAEIALHKLNAFEMKLTDWRKGLAQAYRYSYFSDLSVLVLPPKVAKIAQAEVKLFRKLKVGLWEFDSNRLKIRKLFTPRNGKPRNARAKAKAVESLERFVKLCQPSK